MSVACRRINRVRCHCLFADGPLTRQLPGTERDCGLFTDTANPCSRLVRGESTDVD